MTEPQAPDVSPRERSTPGTVAIVGAGPGIGTSVAHRFGRAGYSVGLIARNAQRIDSLATELTAQSGAEFTTAVADASAPNEVHRALDSVMTALGPITVLCFSPIPDIGLIKPVLETRPDEFMASLQLGVGGAAAAVESVVPGMLAQGRGSLLFTTGSAAISPSSDRAASAVTTTALTAYVSLLRASLDGTGVRVGHTVIAGPIDRNRSDTHHPDNIAADIWAHHQGEPERFPTVIRLAAV